MTLDISVESKKKVLKAKVTKKKKKRKKYAVSIHRNFKCPKNITKLRKFDCVFNSVSNKKEKNEPTKIFF